ncbi:hydrogenase expression/formation protein HypE [Devriesea agamarum]|uniref:hydrogenase expression/formation protein HypE n=1 Tax=Devriesea agamarum TaxID=472569 RepID=UPI0009FF8ABC|nr:hydrogenase expression/formation protein HypE [Devriesea agamarum]
MCEHPTGTGTTKNTLATPKNRLNQDEGQVRQRIETVRRRRPPLSDEVITLAHGAGGKASAALVDAIFMETYGNDVLNGRGDSGLLPFTELCARSNGEGGALAMSTDSYVVTPLTFPGGSIGHLAVHGTVNDLSVAGAEPIALSAAFVLEEGLPVTTLRDIVRDMADAAAACGIRIITGDTKVVAKGSADGLFITTAGIGMVPAHLSLGAQHVRPGDRIIVSGAIGDHGMAVMAARGDLAILAPIASDTRPVTPMTKALLEAVPTTRWMRDATRGGLGTVVNELAADTGLGVALHEDAITVHDMTRGACDMLGIDPLYVANEGVFVAVVPENHADEALAAIRSVPGGHEASIAGRTVSEPAGNVVMVTAFGGTRMVDMLVGDPLPRIC